MHAVYPSAGRAAAMFPHTPRVRALALCLSAALAVPAAIRHAGASPSHTANTWSVGNCADGATNSLRDIIDNHAQSGDTVDLSDLPKLCTMTNSTITLGSEIAIHQNDLTLQGPSEGSVTISGAGLSRVLHHTGSGMLTLYALTVSNGYYHTMGGASGGCIRSDIGDVRLNHVVVEQCKVVSDSGRGKGGGISTNGGNTTLIASRISGNVAKGAGHNSLGGVYSRISVSAKYSSIIGNEAVYGDGGGISARGGATLFASTLADNLAGRGGGLQADGKLISVLDSTISGNVAHEHGGALQLSYDAVVANSTIAFNHQDGSDYAGALFFYGPPNGTLTLQSSIVADNTATAANTLADVYIYEGHGSLAGSDNLVMASNSFDPAVIAIMSDPKLGPLQFNGGATRTHMLLPGSPALGKGNTTGLPAPFDANDQRGPGYPRTTGAGASVDIGAVQFDSIFADDFNSPLF